MLFPACIHEISAIRSAKHPFSECLPNQMYDYINRSNQNYDIKTRKLCMNRKNDSKSSHCHCHCHNRCYHKPYELHQILTDIRISMTSIRSNSTKTKVIEIASERERERAFETKAKAKTDASMRLPNGINDI